LLVFALTREAITCQSLSPMTEVLPLVEDLGFQFSKFQLGSDYYDRHKSALLISIQTLLDRLGDRLLGDVRDALGGSQAVIVIPHGVLHSLPFHALRQDRRYLRAYAYHPSTAALNYCWKAAGAGRAKRGHGKALLVGVPDERATRVTDEIRTIAGLLEGSRVLLNEAATLEHVQAAARDCVVFHLAAHGLFQARCSPRSVWPRVDGRPDVYASILPPPW
jgi:CHAT domain-containing protein